MVLEGNISITVDGETWQLKDEDVILINSNSIHEIHSENGAVMIAVQIKLSLFNQFQTDLTSIVFDCNQCNHTGLQEVCQHPLCYCFSDSGKFLSFRWNGLHELFSQLLSGLPVTGKF